MSDEILKRVDALAAKLGVVSEKLWGVLVKQAYVDGAIDVIIGMGMGLAAWLMYRWSERLWKEYKNGGEYSDKDVAGYVRGVIEPYVKYFAGLMNMLDTVSPNDYLTKLGSSIGSVIVTGKQIGRASCRERVCLYV